MVHSLCPPSADAQIFVYRGLCPENIIFLPSTEVGA